MNLLTNINIDIAVDILNTIVDNPKTRSEIVKEVSKLGHKRPTVYFYMTKLEELSLIKYFEEHKKIYYMITDKGKKFLEIFK